MTSPATGPMRGLRATVLAVLLLAMASLAHAVGGGDVPSPVVLLVLGIVLIPLVLAATRTVLGPRRAAAYLGGAQLGIHLLLHSMHPQTGTSMAAPHVHGGDAAVLAAAHASGALGAPDEMAAMADMSQTGAVLGLTPTMLLAHTVATAVTAWVIARGEEVLWRVVSLLLPRLPRRAWTPPRAVPTTTAPLRALRGAVLSGTLGSRAPPRAI